MKKKPKKTNKISEQEILGVKMKVKYKRSE